jgi:hypothetical protein
VKPRHTPAPWVAVQREFGYPDVEGGPIVRAWDVCSESGVPVAVGTVAAENEANARLIAAAPDMADILGRLLKMTLEMDSRRDRAILPLQRFLKQVLRPAKATLERAGRM